MTSVDDCLAELHCSVAHTRKDLVLLSQRDRGDAVAAAAHPGAHASTDACVRREIREEAGLDSQPLGCAVVLEVNGPRARRRIAELVFRAGTFDSAAPIAGEPGLGPTRGAREYLKGIALHPAIAGFLPDLALGNAKHARHVGNWWLPGPATS